MRLSYQVPASFWPDVGQVTGRYSIDLNPIANSRRADDAAWKWTTEPGPGEIEEENAAVALMTERGENTRLQTHLSSAVWLAPEEAARAENFVLLGAGIYGLSLLLLVACIQLASQRFWPIGHSLLWMAGGSIYGALTGNWITPSIPQRKEGNTLLSKLAADGEQLGSRLIDDIEHDTWNLLFFPVTIDTRVGYSFKRQWQQDIKSANSFIRAYLDHKHLRQEQIETFFCAASGNLCIYPVSKHGRVYEHCVLAGRSESAAAALDLPLMRAISTEFAAMQQELRKQQDAYLEQLYPHAKGELAWRSYAGSEAPLAMKIKNGGIPALRVAEIDRVLTCCDLYTNAMDARNSHIRGVIKRSIEHLQDAQQQSCERSRLSRWYFGAQETVKPLTRFLRSHCWDGLDQGNIERVKRNIYDLQHRWIVDFHRDLRIATVVDEIANRGLLKHLPDAAHIHKKNFSSRHRPQRLPHLDARHSLECYVLDKEYSSNLCCDSLQSSLEKLQSARELGSTWGRDLIEQDFVMRILSRMDAKNHQAIHSFGNPQRPQIRVNIGLAREKVGDLQKQLEKDCRRRQQDPQAPLTHFVYNQAYEEALAQRRRRGRYKKVAAVVIACLLLQKDIFSAWIVRHIQRTMDSLVRLARPLLD